MQRAMTPEEFLYHVYESLRRLGPGCTGATRKAWSYLLSLPEDAQILDVECGTGAQTRDLAGLFAGTVTAVDDHQPFLDTITAWANGEGMGGRVRTVPPWTTSRSRTDSTISSDPRVTSRVLNAPSKINNRLRRVGCRPILGSDASVRFPRLG